MTTEQVRERVREKFSNGKSHKPGNGAAPESPLKIITYGEARAQIDIPYLVKGFLHPLEMSAMIGAPGCGKTFLGLDMDAHIAAGQTWLGHRVRQTPVVYLAAEGGTAIFNRIAAIKARLGFDDSLPLAIVPASLDLRSSAADTEALVKTIAATSLKFGQPVGKVSIDTVSRVLAGGDENSPEDMGALIHNVDRLRNAASVHAMLIHHNTKDGSSGKGGRGHSSLWGALDTEIDVHRDIVTKIATASVYKQRNGPEGAKVSFELESVELGIDSDGDAVTSCIIRPAEGVTRVAGAKMSVGCANMLASLREAVSEAGELPPANGHIPAETKAVRSELWRRYAYARTITDGGSEGAKRKAFSRYSEQLQARGSVAAWNDWVWPC